jgi:hypothetical protein
MTRVAINQSNYIPWRGWFDMVRRVDHFVLYEDVQYTRGEWRNRNRIKGREGAFWLTIPIVRDALNELLLQDAKTVDSRWRKRHWKSIVQAYRKAAGFAQFAEPLEAMYLDSDDDNLSRINERFIRWVCEVLDIDTPISRSSDYELVDGTTERLVDLCRQLGATTYLSGPAAKQYLDMELFAAAGITIEWMSYDGYPQYDQQGADFEPAVSIIDVLLNTGDRARDYLKTRDSACNSPS